jgi:hypothetical protein
MTITLFAGSVEHLAATVTADIELDAQTVEFSTDGETWHAADWEGDPGLTRTARTVAPITWESTGRGPVPVLVRVTDTPEVPIIIAGEVLVRSH